MKRHGGGGRGAKFLPVGWRGGYQQKVLPALLQKRVGDFFFAFSQGNLGNLVGNLAGIFWDFF